MSARETVQPEPEFVAFVGIDWADQKHVWCLQAANSARQESGELEHKPEVVEAWVSELCQRFGHGPIAVAVEQVKGALVYMLRKYECLHLYPVPSTMSASMREALYPSGAKDDPRDAELLLELLVLHRDKLRRLTRHLSRKLCWRDSCRCLETGLKHGIELVKHTSDIASYALPLTLLEGRDGEAELKL